MTRSVLIGTLCIIALVLVLATACGSAPSGVAGSESTKTASWDFTFPGKLESEKDAVAAVTAFLQSEARNDEARLYLAEYAMVARNRVARVSDDGSEWYVTFTMDGKSNADQGEKTYWESAAWMVFTNGKVMPSSRHGAHASRILLDLRAVSR